MNKLLIISFIILFSVLNYAVSSDPIISTTIIEIKTPKEVVYDDGFYRDVFSDYTIYTKNDEKIITIGKVYDTPAKVKLPSGVYKIAYRNSNGRFITKEIEIKGCSFYSIEVE